LAGPAILNWLVAGCLDWQRDGLGTTPAVESATAEYRTAMDAVGVFLEEECVVDPGAFVRYGDLTARFSAWLTETGRYVSDAEFRRGLEQRGHEAHRGSHGVATRRGLRLRPAQEMARPGGRGDFGDGDSGENLLLENNLNSLEMNEDEK